MVFHSHRIYGTGIFSYIYHKHQLNVGKYTSPMDPMGLVFTIKFPFSQQGSPGVFAKVSDVQDSAHLSDEPCSRIAATHGTARIFSSERLVALLTSCSPTGFCYDTTAKSRLSNLSKSRYPNIPNLMSLGPFLFQLNLCKKPKWGLLFWTIWTHKMVGQPPKKKGRVPLGST